MNRSLVYLFVFLFTVSGAGACGSTKSIRELHPGVGFMDKNEVTAFMAGAVCEGENVIVTYKRNGTASVYIKKRKKMIPSAWKIEDDGMITLMTRGHVDKWYTSSDGTTAYRLDGTRVTFTKR